MLIEILQGHTFPEGTQVVDVREWQGEADERPHLYVDLVLSDPSGEHWPPADVRAIRAMARVDGWTVSLHTSRESNPTYRDGRPHLTE